MNAALHGLDRASFATWMAAAVLAVGLHAVGIAYALSGPTEDDEAPDTAGVITLELSPLTTSTALEIPDVATGQLMQEAPNIPEASKQTEAETPETVQLERSPLAPDPEVALRDAKPDERKPEQEKPDDQPARDQQAEPSTGDVTTAAPTKIEAPIAKTTAAAVLGNAREAARAQATWQKTLLAHLDAKKRYPTEARSRGQHGVVRVQFSIDRRGNVLTKEVTVSSGSHLLDEEALAMLARASPLPFPPDTMLGDPISLTLPVQFRIR